MPPKSSLHPLLLSWEQTHKKAQMNLWVLLALKNGHKYVGEVKDYISTTSYKKVDYEMQSIYRLLRNYQEAGIVNFYLGDGNKGPLRKYYYLTDLGERILSQFINRNIELLYSPPIRKILNC